MKQKDFYELLANTESDMEYPYGSCQYETVRIGYLAAKAAGPENLIELFNEDGFIETLRLKGNKEAFLKEAICTVIHSRLKTQDMEENQVQWDTINEAYRKIPILSVIKEDWIWENDDDYQEEIRELEAITDFQDLITWAAEHAYDLWSFPVPVPYPELEPLLTPEVGEGPIFNVMAWGDGYAQGVSMALMEYVMEQEFNWEEWDT
jgi:hypothetical protein